MELAPHSARLLRAAALLPATLAVALASWSLISRDGQTSMVPRVRASASVGVAQGPAGSAGRLLLHFPDGMATVSLDGTQAARAFAAMLPLQLSLNDPMGQAKSGQLPSPIDVADAATVLDPQVGELYYWAPSHTLAIFYDDLGQTLPPPGLVRLGVVNGGLSGISTAGNTFPARIALADRNFTGTVS